MSVHPLQIILFFGFILFFRCAQIVPLSGGKRDVTPPKLIEADPKGLSTHFNSEVIVLRFDEFVQLKDLTGQLIINPKLKNEPEITVDGKKVVIMIKKRDLQPNTTYRFFFGKAIADMHESNAIPNFEYIFSTGSFIDSLKVKGTVSDAFNNKSTGNVLVGLFKDLSDDSLPYQAVPDYITRSNEAGEFELFNLPQKTFRVYGIADKNKNNVYDPESEKIAFLDKELELLKDTVIHFRLFQEEAAKSYIKKTFTPYYGVTNVVMNKKSLFNVRTLHPADMANIYETAPHKEKDTVSIFYKNISDTLTLELSNLQAKKTDTLRISLPKNSSKARLKKFDLNISGGKLVLHEKIKLAFLTWMDTTKSDLSKLSLTSKEDSLVAPAPLSVRWRSVNVCELNYPLKESIAYALKIDTNAFIDVHGHPNDTMRVHFKTESVLDYGKVTLKLLFDKKQDYIIQLINEQDLVIKQRRVSLSLSSSNAESIDFIEVPPGIVRVKVIWDDNKNDKWDSGNLILKVQPEKVMIHLKQIKVLSDWEIEEEIKVSSKSKEQL